MYITQTLTSMVISTDRQTLLTLVTLFLPDTLSNLSLFPFCLC